MIRTEKDILLCADLDRTLLPNGLQPESPEARPLLRRLAERPEVTLAYVSGRDRGLLLEAIREYEIPTPAFAIGDVGTTIYRVEDDAWQPWDAWVEEIAPDWRGLAREDLAALLRGLPGLRLQEPPRQNSFKLSYYAPEGVNRARLLAEIEKRLAARGVRASLIWSVDELKHVGLIDVLPASATKLHAVRFLMREQGFPESRTVFAGDSGNDLPVLISELQAVLVANAAEDVREEAVGRARDTGVEDRLYVARGGFLGMNGNYAAGVLEGLAHYLPEVERWLRAES